MEDYFHTTMGCDCNENGLLKYSRRGKYSAHSQCGDTTLIHIKYVF